jgi:hypothetical protein
LNYHRSRSTLLGIIVKSGPALFMKNGISLKFPSFVGHFRAVSGMKGAGFKHWGHWKVYQHWFSVCRLVFHEDITGLPERNQHIPEVIFII